MEITLIVAAVVAQNRYDRRDRLRLIRRTLRDASDPFALSDTHFTDLFRLTKPLSMQLIDELEPHIHTGIRRNSIPVTIKVLAALSFYASGSYQRRVGQDFLIGLSQTAMSRCVVEVSKAIDTHLADKYIKLPITPDEQLLIKERFFDKTGFPGVIGAIDCTHVAIIKPVEHVEHAYLNRKGFHSKNVQIICDYNLRILSINARYAGGTHDAYIWRCCQVSTELRRRFNSGNNHTSWLLGDSGYPQQPWLMVPIMRPQGIGHEIYNVKHRSARNCIERCNGVLKNRFRCILGERKLHYSPQMAGLITNACAVLHNIMVEARVPAPDISEVDMELINERSFIDDILLEQHGTSELIEGRRIRDKIIHQYF